MPRPRLRHRLEFALHRAALAVCTHVPHAWNRPAGRAVGRLAGALARSKRRLVLENLERAMPELSPAERERIAGACFAHLGANLLETLSSFRFDDAGFESVVDAQGYEHVEEASRRGRGVLLLTAHFGYWEYSGQWVGRRSGNLSAIYRPANNPLFDRDIVRLREGAGIALIPKARASVRILRALREGALVGVLLDQYVPDANAIRVPFFGLESNASPLVAALSLKTGAPILPAFVFPAEGGRYRLRIDPPIEPPSDAGTEGEAAVAALTERCLASLEREIRERPELWLWMHRRWRDEPPNPVSGGDAEPTHG